MRATCRLGILGAILVLAGMAGGVARGEEAWPPERVPPRPPDQDLREIRNIFAYGDETTRDAALRLAPSFDEAEAEETPAPPRVRLVGFVERVDGMVVALAIDDEVRLLSEGETALGFTVLGLGDEAVVLRDPAGDEVTLALP